MFIIDNRYPGLRRSVKEQGKVDTSQDNVRWARDLENRPVKKRPVLTVLAQDKPPNSPPVVEKDAVVLLGAVVLFSHIPARQPDGDLRSSRGSPISVALALPTTSSGNMQVRTFPSAWTYSDNYDKRNVIWPWVGKQSASTSSYVNSANNAISKLTIPRMYPIILRETLYTVYIAEDLKGSVFIIDALHLPYGCLVWPSVWTNGPNWPNDGEIGIIESVNLMPNNQIALHTTPAALTQHPKTSRGPLWSTTEVRVRGVPLRRRKGTALGLALLLHRGGVLAAQFDVSGIYIWFWSRADIPESITQLTSTSPVDTSSWGDPSSAYPPPSCKHQRVLCPSTARNRHHSVWASLESIYQETSLHRQTDDNVYGPGRSTYDGAYFEIQQHPCLHSVFAPSSTGTNSTSATSTTSTAGSNPATTSHV
ncbi:glycoside hydrolase family 16 protein [Serpula lacrymans var. lacrymans S7.3]|uniref:Glycoside hydrolase family 16 protein n=1 Tax=Serpula lacrymans var. lacrymans (strain S7.3) TaxID=936435 RepID=F8QA47_SERL3|nr:glycoside hydrolase family 16 protein [Serpula lacrymans var. lacrymans S7.3]